MSEFERALVLIGRELDVPDTPDVVHPVLARLEPTTARRPRRRLALAVALAALAALAATLAVPDARSALFRVLHIGGERIEFVDELPAVDSDPVELEIVLGERVSLREARRRAGFELRELDDAPDRVYLGARGTVWFLYGEPDGVRLLVAQTPRHGVEETLIRKKLVGGATQVEQVFLDGSRAFFLSGEPHLVLLLDERGKVVEESTRLASNVLIWEKDGVAFRLEGDFSRGQAVDLALSLR